VQRLLDCLLHRLRWLLMLLLLLLLLLLVCLHHRLGCMQLLCSDWQLLFAR
jgi:hypothetical protein